MLLSLLKILIFFAVILAISLGAVYLSEHGHALRMVYNGTEYTLGPIQLLVAAVLFMVLAWAVFRLIGLMVAVLRFIIGDETAINRYFARSRERKGYEALSEGMLALASGEGRLAQKQASKAAKYLDKPHVTDVMEAQAAEMNGDRAVATEAYKRLLDDDRTRFVGVRGLMRQKLAEGDTATALKLAEKAYALKPKHQEVQDTLLQLQTVEGDWKGARAMVKEKRKLKQLPSDVAIRRDSVLALQEAREVLAEGNSISAREAAISANRASPDLIPAAVLAARSYIDQKDSRSATRVLQKAWSVRPHPSLAAAFADIVPDETPVQRLRRFETLIRQNPDDEESHLLQAELLLAAEDFPGARRALGKLAETHPTVRTLSIMAAIERGEGGDDAIVRGWLTRALTASRGPQWVCDKCHNVMAEWAPVCDSCGGFDTLTWREPDGPRSASYAPSGAEMLPLLVQAPVRAQVDEAPSATISDDDDAPPVAGLVPRAEVSDKAKPAPKAPAEVADVPPGIVPRESDYIQTHVDDAPEPAMTLTDPDPTPEPVAKPAPSPKAELVVEEVAVRKAPTKAAKDSRFIDETEVWPLPPDVEPPEDDIAPAAKKG